MRKMGDRREDGYVFVGYSRRLNGKTYESWTALDKFFKKYGEDFFDRRDARLERQKAKQESSIKWHAHMAYLSTLSEEERKDRDRQASKRSRDLRLAEDPDYYKRLNQKAYQRKKSNPEYKRRTKEASKKHQEKKKAERAIGIAKRKAESEAKKKAKAEEIAARKKARAKLSAEKALAKSLRPKRIVLTDEQRAEARRKGKRNYKHARRARINNCEVKATPKMVEDARKQAGDRCYYCGKKAELTLDHFEPLAKGGSHCVLNFVFCCHPCNSRKRDLDPFDFMASNLAVSF